MATKPKKNSTQQTLRKKRKYSKKNKQQKKVFILLGLLFVVALMTLGYFLGKNNSIKLPTPVGKKESYSTKELLDDLAFIQVKEAEKDDLFEVYTQEIKEVKKKKIPFEEKGKETSIKKAIKEKKKSVTLKYHGKKPRLAIIIDDVHTKDEIKAIKKLGIKITPSIFPPYKLSKRSHLLAKQVKHYMIHLPMESASKKFNKQTKTLMTSFSDERIIARVLEIRRLFPDAKYVNNHTGSVFTTDYKAMKKLYSILRAEGFIFIDSFTIATSKVKKIAHKFGDVYVRRDVFIDNKHTVPYIHKQLKIAVQKAKKNGYAIAIGHPHKVTMKAIRLASKILKDVELVYIDEVYRKK